MSTNTNDINNANENSANTLEPFSFKYVQSGGLANNYLVISFDSESSNLKVSTDISSTNLTQKPIEDSEKITFIDIIRKNNFLIQNVLMLLKRKMNIMLQLILIRLHPIIILYCCVN